MFEYDTSGNAKAVGQIKEPSAAAKASHPIDETRPNLALLRASIDAVTGKARNVEESLREHAVALTGGWPEPGEANANGDPETSCGEVEQLLRGLSRLEDVIDRLSISTHHIGRIRG